MCSCQAMPIPSFSTGGAFLLYAERLGGNAGAGFAILSRYLSVAPELLRCLRLA